jgi:hypothetical protein
MTPVEWALAAAAVLALMVLYFAWTVRITVANPTHLELRVGESKTVEAVLFRKPAFRRTPERTQGTVKVFARSNIVSVSPGEAGTSHQTAASFTVIGAVAGEGNAFTLQGTSRHGSHEAVQITAKVTAAG